MTSASEMARPGISDDLFVFDDQLFDTPKIRVTIAGVLGNVDLWLNPVLRLAIGGNDVDVEPGFLTREKLDGG